eukprot:gb/GECG01003647.1/.p1 GENE.gb/GECG01003647.1/~~gb/GECG01003647.1/.p1  ORF type:complete len:120 (+),score=7.06 gb/GECG01003647.1/:1-360(+)
MNKCFQQVCAVRYRCDLIDDMGAQQLLLSLPSLAIVRFGGCSLLTEKLFSVLQSASSQKYLYVDLSYVDFCSPQFAMQLVASCPNIAVTDYYCNLHTGALARYYIQWTEEWSLSRDNSL